MPKSASLTTRLEFTRQLRQATSLCTYFKSAKYLQIKDRNQSPFLIGLAQSHLNPLATSKAMEVSLLLDTSS